MNRRSSSFLTSPLTLPFPSSFLSSFPLTGRRKRKGTTHPELSLTSPFPSFFLSPHSGRRRRRRRRKRTTLSELPLTFPHFPSLLFSSLHFPSLLFPSLSPSCPFPSSFSPHSGRRKRGKRKHYKTTQTQPHFQNDSYMT